MVLPITKFVTSSKKTNTNKKPMFNDIPFTVYGSNTMLGGPQLSYREFWNQFKMSPELIGVLSVPIIDILGDRPEFTDQHGNPLGRNKLLQMKKFWRDNRIKDALKGGLFDGFVTGDGYWWIGRLSQEERLDKVKELCDKYFNLLKSKEDYNKLFLKASQDEDLKKPKKFDYVASSTMQIIHNKREIEGYTQNIQGEYVTYQPSEIIHYRYMNIDGKVNGFSPVEALSAEIWLLWFVKQNMLSYSRNGGSPSKVFVLPEEIANSDNHKFLVQTLQRYQAVQNRNGNLVFTGNIDIKDLVNSPKDMEYENLALFTASNIAFAYGVPVTRIPYLIGKSATSGDSGGLAESGYWNKISEIQDEIEDLLNSQLFEDFGVNVHLNRKYKQDEVRESQVCNMNADTIIKYQSIFRAGGKSLSEKYISQFLNIPLEELSDLPPAMSMEDDEEEEYNTENQNRLSDDDVMKEPDNRKRADTKRNVANSKVNKGLSV